jgi:hypothetical protein
VGGDSFACMPSLVCRGRVTLSSSLHDRCCIFVYLSISCMAFAQQSRCTVLLELVPVLRNIADYLVQAWDVQTTCKHCATISECSLLLTLWWGIVPGSMQLCLAVPIHSGCLPFSQAYAAASCSMMLLQPCNWALLSHWDHPSRLQS